MKKQFIGAKHYAKKFNSRLFPNVAFAAYKEDGEDAELLAKIKDTAKAAIDKAIEENKNNSVSKAEFEALKAKYEASVSKEDFEAVKAEAIKMAGEIAALKEEPAKKENEGFGSQIVKGLQIAKEDLANLISKKGASVRVVAKAAGTMTTANVTAVGTNGLAMLLNSYEPGITAIPRSAPFFADLFSQVPTNGNTVSYAEMKNPDGGAGMTAEGAAKSQADFDFVEAKADVKKITAFIKTSKEALGDIAGLAGEINGELMTLVKLKKDTQVMLGDNTGNNLNGVITQATAFSAPVGLASAIPAPNNYDVLVAAITQIMTAEVISGEPAGFLANVIVLHPVDVAAMKLTKDTTGNYVFPVTLPGSTNVMEVAVVSNARMTQGEFLVMDSSKGNLRIREDVTFDIGYENDDFTKNLVTILAEMRLAFFIKSNHAKAFVTGDFTTAKAALTAAP